MRILCVCGIALMSCVQRHHNEARTRGVEAGPYPSDALSCSDVNGTASYWTLTGEGMEFRRDEVGLLGEFVASPAEKTRLDICVTADAEAVLKRVLVLEPMRAGAWTRGFHILTPDSADHKAGLTRLLAENNPSALHVEFRNQHNPKVSYLLKGWKSPAGRPLVTLSVFDASRNAPLEVLAPGMAMDRFHGYAPVSYGILEEGDPWDQGASCRKVRKVVRADGASLKLEYCIRGDHAMYINYKFDSLELEDRNPRLPVPVSLQARGNAPVRELLAVKETHHSLSDEFTVKTATATYGIVAGANGYVFSIKYMDPSIPSIEKPLDCQRVYACGDDLMAPQ